MRTHQSAKAPGGTVCTYFCAFGQNTRSFHSSMIYERQLVPAPWIKHKESAKKKDNPHRNPKSSRPWRDAHTIWPLSLLRSAYRSRALQIEPETAVSFLESYTNLTKPNVNTVEKLCQSHSFGPLTLTRLARILIHSSSKDHRDIARRLLFTASDLHDSNATLQLISEGIRKSGLTNPQLAKPLRRLSYLAETSKNPSAMNLLGQILERQGEADKALGLYEDVVNAENDRYGGADDEDGNIAQAWLALGRIKAKNRDVAGAEAALKKAALEFDDPTAYFYLARFRNPKSDDYHLYNLKAASSGLLEAAHNLGIFYLQRSKSDKQTSSSVETKLDDGRDAISGSPQSTPTQTLSSTNSANGSIRNTGQELSLNKTRTTAYEWFAVAAEGGFASSQINLALLLRGDGSYVDGMAWLKHAEGHPDLGPEVERLKGQWFNKRVNLSGNVP